MDTPEARISPRLESATDSHRRADQRIEELDALVSFLHADVECHKDRLARVLHDELGGSVIAALMDVAWIEQHEAPLSQGVTTRLARVKEALRESIDLARRLVEELRPTLLDSIGLFAALSWQFRRGCGRVGLTYTEEYPETVPDLETSTLIGVFRVVQEAFNVIIKHEGITAIHLAVETIEDVFTFELSDDGALPQGTQGELATLAVSSMVHRARNIGAELMFAARGDGGSVFRLSIPIPSASPAS